MDIENIRREYTQAGLKRSDLKADPMEQFEDWLSIATKTPMTDPTAMSVATVGENGMPSLRTVLLKYFNEKGFVFFTNLDSRKARELKQNNKIALLFPWVHLERQVIVTGEVEFVSTAESMKYFLSRPKDSQIAALASHQSRPINSRAMLEEKFLQLKNQFKNGDISLPSFWGGVRIKPVQIEFWQGRANRLHDRFMYTKGDNGEWSVDRLAP
jgi:pyridoxamine 5'-phosphate oxidase|tara:strand:- start:1038 stop:1676 length:639 start_codon:yes stop_codon:yes gene_type:complete